MRSNLASNSTCFQLTPIQAWKLGARNLLRYPEQWKLLTNSGVTFFSWIHKVLWTLFPSRHHYAHELNLAGCLQTPFKTRHIIEGWRKTVLQWQRLQRIQRHPHEHGRLHTQKGAMAIRVMVKLNTLKCKHITIRKFRLQKWLQHNNVVLLKLCRTRAKCIN